MYFHRLFQEKMHRPLECAHLSQLTTQGQNPLSLDEALRQLRVMNLTLSVLALSLKKMVMWQAGAGKCLVSTGLIHNITHKNNYPHDLFLFEKD